MSSLRWGLRVAAAAFVAGCALAAPAPESSADAPDAPSGGEVVGMPRAAAGPPASARAADRRARVRGLIPTMIREAGASGRPTTAPTVQAGLAASAPAAASAVPRITRRPLQDITARTVRTITPLSDWLADYPAEPSPPLLQGALDLLRRSLSPAPGSQRTPPEWSKPTSLKLENGLGKAIFVAEVHGDSADPDSQSRELAEPVSVGPGEIFVGSPNSSGLPNCAQVTKLWLWVNTPPVKGKPEFELVVLTLPVLEPPDWSPIIWPRVTVWDEGPPLDNWWSLQPPGKGTSGGKAFFPTGALFFATERTDEFSETDYGTKDFYWAVAQTLNKTPV